MNIIDEEQNENYENESVETKVEQGKKAIKERKEKLIKADPKYYFSTGSTLLDLLVGGGVGLGYPAGRIINTVGNNSSSKSFLACELIAKAHYQYKDKFKWVYDDSESGFSFDTKKLYGFEIMPVNLRDRTRSKTVEELFGNLSLFIRSLKSDEIGIYVVDSLDGLVSQTQRDLAEERIKAHENDREFDKSSYGAEKAKFLSSTFFPNIAEEAESKNCLVVIISQTRDKIGAYYPTQERVGGKAMDFYAHTCLWLTRLSEDEINGIPVSVSVRAKNKKSKTPRPWRNCVYTINFSYGLDDIATNLDYLFDFRTDKGTLIKKAEACWGGTPVTATALKDFLKTHSEFVPPEIIKARKSEQQEFVFSQPFLLSEYKLLFGETKSRNELIRFIEENNLEEELRQRVIAKWEETEQAVVQERKPKY